MCITFDPISNEPKKAEDCIYDEEKFSCTCIAGKYAIGNYIASIDSG